MTILGVVGASNPRIPKPRRTKQTARATKQRDGMNENSSYAGGAAVEAEKYSAGSYRPRYCPSGPEITAVRAAIAERAFQALVRSARLRQRAVQ